MSKTEQTEADDALAFLAELNPDERQALKEIAEARVDGSVGRREFLKAGGALGFGALLGGGSYAASTEPARAQTATGDVGTPTDLVDVYGATVNAEEITLNGDTKTAWPSGGGDVSVSDSGTQVVAAASDLNFAAPLTVADDSDGTVTLDVNLDMGTL